MLDETFAASPTCFLNARRQKLTDVFAAWNVVTHGHKLRSRSCFVLTLSPIPSQGEVEAVTADPDIQLVAITLVGVTVPGRAKRVNVTLDEALLGEIDEVADNRSRFLAKAARAELAQRSAG
jgi:HicB_like antitoxin of bacterial toxin-antitoxin system